MRWLDKFAAKMMLWLGAFFAWVEEITGLEYRRYNVFGKDIGVHWPIVVTMFLIWFLMVVLPWIF